MKSTFRCYYSRPGEFYIGPDTTVKAKDLVSMDSSTGLLRPKAGSRMVLGDGSIVDVPRDYFVHPQTGHVLPIQGNVSFFIQSESAFLFTS